ncbi:MAG: 2OG-Fe(II) oxygenase [Rhodobacter sp.]|nr:2OG-Fe(II) oxygenase [Rhodobacter sp.]
MDLETFRQDSLYAAMSRLVEKCFPDEDISFFSVFCNCISYGCHTFMHQDGGEDCFSALYYANPEWNVDWGGETTFFDDDGDAIACIAPVPGRIIVLDGRIQHRAGMPSRSCPRRRYTISLRCDLEEGAARRS